AGGGEGGEGRGRERGAVKARQGSVELSEGDYLPAAGGHGTGTAGGRGAPPGTPEAQDRQEAGAEPVGNAGVAAVPHRRGGWGCEAAGASGAEDEERLLASRLGQWRLLHGGLGRRGAGGGKAGCRRGSIPGGAGPRHRQRAGGDGAAGDLRAAEPQHRGETLCRSGAQVLEPRRAEGL